MNYKIIPTEHFKQQVRMLQKDYPNIRHDLQELHRMLVENPKCGKPLGKKSIKFDSAIRTYQREREAVIA